MFATSFALVTTLALPITPRPLRMAVAGSVVRERHGMAHEVID